MVSECKRRTMITFHKMHPNEQIPYAKPIELLNLHGGPLTDDEWDDGRYNYIEMPNIIYAPIKDILEQNHKFLFLF